MKGILTLLACSLLFCCSARNHTLDKLSEVNACWPRQPEVTKMTLPVHRAQPEKEWIRLHLALVEKTLRKRSVNNLTDAQRKQRSRSLDHLRAYWRKGCFPVNGQYAYRTPIFIDAQDNFCAVGYLLKASGYEAVSRKIAASTNLAYVQQMQYPELNSWANEHGFTREELAWIQPAYPTEHQAKALGKGVSGSVNELFTEQGGDKLYVGGAFDQVDSSIGSRNIAYVTREASGNYIWHDMGSGVNGVVHAITSHEGKIFAGGQFTMAGTATAGNIAYWENSGWHPAGCLDGTVADLTVFNGRLYAAGTFDLCAGLADVNLAYWNGTGWIAVPGLSGTVKTMEAVGNRLILGGSFSYQGAVQNAIAWNPNDGFRAFDSPVENTVLDFETFKGSLYAVCEQLVPDNVPDIFLKLEGNEWRALHDATGAYYIPVNGKLSMNTLLVDGDYLLAGGQFVGGELVGTLVGNTTDITPLPLPQSKRFFWLDSTVNKMVWFGGELIAGGRFRAGFNGTSVNGIARRALNNTSAIPSTPEQYAFSVAPNPVTESVVWLQNSWGASTYGLMDVNGRVLQQGALNGDRQRQRITLPAVPAGLYFLQLGNEKGLRAQQKLLVQ